jgi:hypothetical protein
MASTAFQQIEALLRARHLDGTLARLATPDAGPSLAPTDLGELDRALGGGWRRGEISELIGPVSSGRTSLCVATLISAVRRGEVVALVDACDRFDAVTSAGAGLDLSRVLWVRGPDVWALDDARAPLVERLARNAVRAFDLIIRAGGFGVVVLDVADVPARLLRQMPMTTWLRLAHANEGRETVGLLVSATPLGRSARGVSVRLSSAGRWVGESDRSRRLEGLDIRAEVVSARLGVSGPAMLRM